MIGLALAVLVLALPTDAISASGAALWLAFIVPIAALWILYALVRLAFKPADRKERAIRLAIWVPTIIVAVLSMQYQDSRARDTASMAIAVASEYQKRTGGYPKELIEIGLNAEELRSKFSMSYRLQSDGKAFLLYSQPSMPLVAHRYDIQAGKWERSD